MSECRRDNLRGLGVDRYPVRRGVARGDGRRRHGRRGDAVVVPWQRGSKLLDLARAGSDDVDADEASGVGLAHDDGGFVSSWLERGGVCEDDAVGEPFLRFFFWTSFF